MVGCRLLPIDMKGKWDKDQGTGKNAFVSRIRAWSNKSTSTANEDDAAAIGESDALSVDEADCFF